MIQTVRNGEGKAIGTFDTDTKVLTKKVVYKKHHLHTFKAWAIDSKVLNNPKLDGGWIELLIGSKSVKVAADLWREHGFEKDLGHGLQTLLADKYFV